MNKKRFMPRLMATLFLVSVSAPLSAQWLDWRSPLVPRNTDGSPEMSAPVPRTADDLVDLSGLWVPDRARGSVFDESMILGWALEAMVENEADFYTNDPRFHCLPTGPSFLPAGRSAGGTRQILQHPEIVGILHSDMTYRQIYMDGRELESDPILRTWMGYSTGHWEGDTLVVESNGYNDKTWLIREGLPHTEQLRITERYTRLDYGRMQLEIHYVDPGTFTGPVQATVDLVLTPDSALLEVVCNESDTGTRHYSGEIEQSEEKVVNVAVEILERYVGTYQGIWLGNLITAEVTLADGELFLTRAPRYSDTGGNTAFDTSRLIPVSENAFDSLFGLGWVFNVDEDGEVTSVSEVHVSGAWPFERVE